MKKQSLVRAIRKPFRFLKRLRLQQKERRIFQRSLRPSDIFIVGHPKSGNTWLTLMLGILIEKKYEKKITLANIKEFIPAIHSRDKDLALFSHLPDPRFFRNEGPVYPDLYPKTIYIIRDPRATYVSYYHHCVHDTGNINWKIGDFVDEMLAFGCIRDLEPFLIRWDRQVANWLERSKNQPVKIVKYEEMKKDSRKVLVDMLKFAGLKYNENDIDAAVERTSFENMRKEEQMYGAEPYSGTKGEKGYFVRKGKIDGWKEELPQEVSRKIEDAFSEVMLKVGYL